MAVTRGYDKGTLTRPGGLRPEHPGEVRDTGLQPRSHAGLRAGPIHRTTWGEASTRGGRQAQSGHRGKLALLDTGQPLRQVVPHKSSPERGCSKPAKVHKGAARHALRYLKQNSDQPITYRKGYVRMHAHAAASFTTTPDNRKSFPQVSCNSWGEGQPASEPKRRH